LRLLLDEMHSPGIADALVADGWDVVAVARSPALRTRPDEELLAHAAEDRRALVTENVSDFASILNRWAANGRQHARVIFTSPKRFNRATLAYPGDLLATLRALLEDPPPIERSGTWWL
jgi:hypothetical protein